MTDSPENAPRGYLIPTVIVKEGQYERAYDIYSMLLKDHIIFVNGKIDTGMACSIVAQLLYLEMTAPDKDITLYIDSPGGAITAGNAIIDTMNLVKPDVATIVVGQAASMGAWILASGAKGKRQARPHADIMIHQPLGGMQGQADDMEIQNNHMQKTKRRMIAMMARATGKTEEEIKKDVDRDNFLDAEEAIAYGIIDNVVTGRAEKPRRGSSTESHG